MLRPTRRRALLFGFLAVAVVGLKPLADLTRDDAADAAAAAAALGNSPAPGTSAVAAPDPSRGPPVVVLARSEDWTKYLDLVIKLLALVLAWFTQRQENQAPGKSR